MKSKRIALMLAVAMSGAALLPHSFATTDAMEPYIGEIKWVAFSFAPRGWARCDGQLLPISQYTALFSLIGTIYGGDGRTTFSLPDARGRAFVHEGQIAGSTARGLGEKFGSEQTQLFAENLAWHSHALMATSFHATAHAPQNQIIAEEKGNKKFYEMGNAVMAQNAIGSSGDAMPMPNMMPSKVLNCIIALEGIYPSRN